MKDVFLYYRCCGAHAYYVPEKSEWRGRFRTVHFETMFRGETLSDLVRDYAKTIDWIQEKNGNLFAKGFPVIWGCPTGEVLERDGVKMTGFAFSGFFLPEVPEQLRRMEIPFETGPEGIVFAACDTKQFCAVLFTAYARMQIRENLLFRIADSQDGEPGRAGKSAANIFPFPGAWSHPARR